MEANEYTNIIQFLVNGQLPPNDDGSNTNKYRIACDNFKKKAKSFMHEDGLLYYIDKKRICAKQSVNNVDNAGTNVSQSVDDVDNAGT